MDHPGIDHQLLGVPVPVPDVRYFLAGGMSAALSHGATTPIDVVKTKIQARPELYRDLSLLRAAERIVETDGVQSLLGGLGPTVAGYGVEGAAKFGLYESLKPAFEDLLGVPKSEAYLGASVVAGAVAALMLCPLERARIRIVTEEEEDGEGCGGGGGLVSTLRQIVSEDESGRGALALFDGFGAMLSKQVPYTIFKQVSFDYFAATLYAFVEAYTSWNAADVKAEVSVAAAFCASILACIASHPGDVILTETYKEQKSDDNFYGSAVPSSSSPLPTFGQAAAAIYNDEGGTRGFFTGITARFLHVGAIITSQLVFYDFVKQALGLPATGT